jgi:hypothetical protein
MNETLLWMMLIFLTSAISGVAGIMVTFALMSARRVSTDIKV